MEEWAYLEYHRFLVGVGKAQDLAFLMVEGT
jgi:hypothetical protein